MRKKKTLATRGFSFSSRFVSSFLMAAVQIQIVQLSRRLKRAPFGCRNQKEPRLIAASWNPISTQVEIG
jgi:hypothetical protein